jgi:hypothetical protein
VLGGDAGAVDEADDDADAKPFDEVGDGLLERECATDVEIDVVVDDEGADGEDADERAEAGALHEAGAGLVEHGVKYGEDQHGHKHGQHAGRHDGFYSLLGAVHGGIFQEFVAERGDEAEGDTADREIDDEGTESCQDHADEVHG